MTKYVVISDIHAHNWSLFSSTLPSGVNSRLQFILDEMERAAELGLKENAQFMVIAGDLFHLRGVIDPEVLNPVRSTIENILHKMDILAIPGNHDLKSRDTKELSSAIQNMNGWAIKGDDGQTRSFRVINKPTALDFKGAKLGFVPWCYEKEGVLEGLNYLKSQPEHEKMDVFIHYGIDGVLPIISGDELTPKELIDFGFNRVFAGHYHNHKTFHGGICSIGAIAHHNWGDINSRAGFLIIDSDDKDILYIPSKAPNFVDISGMDEDSLIMSCQGNYVRYRGEEMSSLKITELRTALTDYGACGVSIEAPKTVGSLRSKASTTKAVSIETAVQNYIDTLTIDPAIDSAKLKSEAVEVLNESRLALVNT